MKARFEGSNCKSSVFSDFVSTRAPSRFREGENCGILRAMFLGSDFKSSIFSDFVSTGVPSRFREGGKMRNFEGQV